MQQLTLPFDDPPFEETEQRVERADDSGAVEATRIVRPTTEQLRTHAVLVIIASPAPVIAHPIQVKV